MRWTRSAGSLAPSGTRRTVSLSFYVHAKTVGLNTNLETNIRRIQQNENRYLWLGSFRVRDSGGYGPRGDGILFLSWRGGDPPVRPRGGGGVVVIHRDTKTTRAGQP